MKVFITFLLLVALFGIIFTLSFAEQNQTTQKPDPTIETLEKRILVLENKLQTVENVKKMELAAKLADANAKLANAEFGRFERELKDANDGWLMKWNGFFIGVLAVIGVALWFSVKSLITDRIEKSLNGFKEAMNQVGTLKNELKEAAAQVNILQDQIRILEKEHAASVLENFAHSYIGDEDSHPEQISALREEILLQLFSDETLGLAIREKAVEVLAARKSPQLIFPGLELLNSILDSDFDWQTSITGERLPFRLLSFVGQIHTDEAHQGVKKFLSRLLTENPEHKDLFLTWTVYYLADIDVELGVEDSISMIKKAIPNLDNLQQLPHVVGRLVEYFNTFNELEGIKDILTNGLTDGIPEVETRCLELLQKHDPDFVEEWKAQKEFANTQNEESS